MSAGDFSGCKLALICGERVLVYARDRKEGILYPGLLDLPGGAREGRESPEECVLRELAEEFGLRLAAERLLYRSRYALPDARGHAWFFAGRLDVREIAEIEFGDEGSHWELLPIEEFLVHPQAIPHLQARLCECLSAFGGARGYSSE